MPEQPRTAQQNKALHLYFRHLADALNDAGLDMRAVLKPEVEIAWDSRSVKEYLWRPVQDIQLGKRSTTELTTKEIDLVFDTVNRYIAKHGVHVPFPSIEEVMHSQTNDQTN